jgi:ubiquinone biosynthesis protein COQ9
MKEEAMNMNMDTVRDEILVATLPNVVFDGWTALALRDGTHAAGHDLATAQRAFPGGIPELIEHFGAWTDRQMAGAMAAAMATAPPADFASLRSRIALAVRSHFEVLEPYLETRRRLLAHLALPQNLGLGLALLYRTVDAMWEGVGDVSTDFSHYTRRALLAGVVSATTFYWLDDPSEGHRDTWAFLDRRLSDVMGIGQAAARAGNIRQLVSHLPSPLRFARQMRQRTKMRAGPGGTIHMAENI